MLKKILNWFFLIAIVFAVLVITVAVVELYCAYSYYRYRDTLKNNLSAIRLREPFHNTNQLVKIGPTNNYFKTDSFGFILPYKALDSSENVIVFIGGSTTECMAVSEGKRVHKAVENQLNNVSCLNIGNSGNHSMHSLGILANKLIAFKPNVVVINHNVNDLSVLLNTGTYFNNNKHRSLLLTNSEQLYSYKVGFPKNWFVKTYIPYISLVLLPTTFEGEKLIDDNEFDEDTIPSDLDLNSIKLSFKRSLTGLINYAKSWDIKPVIMTQGSCFKCFEIENIEKYEAYDLAKLHQEFNQIIRQVAKECETELVDAEFLMKDNSSYFYDTVHYTDSGSVFISKHIAKAVSKVLYN